MVRAYAAEGFMKMAPQKADSVFSLMADQTPVETMAGCMKGVEPIGVIAARTLAWNSPVGSLKGLSDRAAGDSGIPKKTVEFFQGLVARRQAEGVARKAASDFMVKQGKDPLRFDYYVKEITKSWLGRRTASVVAHEKRQTAAAAASRDIKLQVDLASGQVTVVK
jgi:hypothetical protein